MALPKINLPITKTYLPSTGEMINIRPYTVKEEKILLQATETQDISQILMSIRQVINNCIVDELDVDKISQFDMEFIFLQLHAISKNDVVGMMFTNKECNKEAGCPNVLKVEIPISEIKVCHKKGDIVVPYDPTINPMTKRGRKIDLGVPGGIGVMMRYPTVKDMEILSEKMTMDFDERMIINCIEGVYDDENYVPSSESSVQELYEFIQSVPNKAKEKMRQFIDSTPMLYHKVEVCCPVCKYKENIELIGIKDFFG